MPLMKKVGVDSTWLCQPETSCALTVARWAPASSSRLKRARSRPNVPASREISARDNCAWFSNKRSCISQNLPWAAAASAASAAISACGNR